MSRLGKRPIEIPAKVKLTHVGGLVTVEGPKGKVTTPILEGITLKVDGTTALLTRASEEKSIKAKHGLCRMLLANAVNGVVNEYRKELEVFGVGYKCALEGKTVVLNLGYSHAIKFPIPEGIKIEIDKTNRITISGADRQQVGQVAAEIRSLRRPDPYKGKGIKYTKEVLRLKAGKAGGKK
jgi:large subunit ribosomal protein L6